VFSESKHQNVEQIHAVANHSTSENILSDIQDKTVYDTYFLLRELKNKMETVYGQETEDPIINTLRSNSEEIIVFLAKKVADSYNFDELRNSTLAYQLYLVINTANKKSTGIFKTESNDIVQFRFYKILIEAESSVKKYYELDQVRVLKGIDYLFLFDFSYHEIRGFWIVIFTALILGVIIVISPRLSKNKINKYRPYEMKLLTYDKLNLDDMLQYHAQYHWGDYAAAAISMMMISITFIVANKQDLNLPGQVVQSIAVLLMAAATIFLVWADLVHTNTQTPIIPIMRRFKLIDISVEFGTLSVMAILIAMQLFVALISFWITILVSVIYIFVFIIVMRARRIDYEEFFDYFKISEEEQIKDNWHKKLDNSLQGTVDDFRLYKTIPYKHLKASSKEESLYKKYYGLISQSGLSNYHDLEKSILDLLAITEKENEILQGTHNRALKKFKHIISIWMKNKDSLSNYTDYLFELGDAFGISSSEIKNLIYSSDNLNGDN